MSTPLADRNAVDLGETDGAKLCSGAYAQLAVSLVSMPRRTDSKNEMIKAGRRLYSARGYVGTAFSDVLSESGAPRGSVYFHFPGGKDEFAREVVAAHSRWSKSRMARLAASCSTPQQLLVAYLQTARDHAVATGYKEGCPIGAVVLEAAHASPELLAVAGQSLATSIAVMTALLVERGADEHDAQQWATAAVTGFEGALIVARALQDPSPFDAIIDTLRRATV